MKRMAIIALMSIMFWGLSNAQNKQKTQPGKTVVMEKNISSCIYHL